mmetsp:Transcript_23601/g.54003  ORF Transcript_23601/g.54003 Transcript_23601/m.54003 type:complete len:314 (+) Transcript_23601:63-1004(+)
MHKAFKGSPRRLATPSGCLVPKNLACVNDWHRHLAHQSSQPTGATTGTLLPKVQHEMSSRLGRRCSPSLAGGALPFAQGARCMRPAMAARALPTRANDPNQSGALALSFPRHPRPSLRRGGMLPRISYRSRSRRVCTRLAHAMVGGSAATGAESTDCFPSSLRAVFSMNPALSPASSYCSPCPAASMYLSGSTIGRTLSFPSSSLPLSARKCSTWSPKPPMEPSSTVMRMSCSSASLPTSSVSSGFIHRASATVTPTLPSASSSARAAVTAQARRVPRLRIATRDLAPARACRITRPLPTGSTVPFSGISSSS